MPFGGLSVMERGVPKGIWSAFVAAVALCLNDAFIPETFTQAHATLIIISFLIVDAVIPEFTATHPDYYKRNEVAEKKEA